MSTIATAACWAALLFASASALDQGTRAGVAPDEPRDAAASRTPELALRARAQLARLQNADGRWPAALSPAQHRFGIEALAALALASGTAAERQKAQRAVAALAATPRQDHAEYAGVIWTLAALETEAERSDKLEDASIRRRLRQELGAMLAADSFESRETCYRSLAFWALTLAKTKNLVDDDSRISKLSDELRARQAGPDGMFHAHEFASRSYGATALACEALARAGQSSSQECQRSLRWLERQATRTIPEDTGRGKYPSFYLRGRRLFELRAHLAALRVARRDSFDRVATRITKRLQDLANDDATLEGYYGKLYGTALLVLCLVPH